MANPIYTGVFFDKAALMQKVEAIRTNPLAREIAAPHITFRFRPSEQEIHAEKFGTVVKASIIGYANDGENEGVLVAIESSDDTISEMASHIPVQHITLSVSETGKPVNTSKLDFAAINTAIEVSGVFGGFYPDGAVHTDCDRGHKVEDSVIEAFCKLTGAKVVPEP